MSDAIGTEELRDLVDRQRIAEVMAAYTRLADLNRPEEQVLLFTPDCATRYHPGPWLQGREALLDFLRGALATYAATSHHLSGIEIAFAPGGGQGRRTATAHSYVLAWHRRRNGTEWTLFGRYVDDWVQDDGQWLLARRELRVAGAAGRDDSGFLPLGRVEALTPEGGR